MFIRCVALWGAATFASDTARACSCVPTDVPSSWFLSSDAYIVDVLRTELRDGQRYYAAKVQEAFKGCAVVGDTIALETPDNEAMCGITLDVGQRYLMFGAPRQSRGGYHTIGVGLCAENKLASEITAGETTYLLSRPVLCAGSELGCANGAEPLQCATDPCRIAQPCGEALTCVPNACHGGCDWEQYDAFGKLACFGP